MTTEILTQTEVRVLQNLQLMGCTGKMGRMNLQQRRILLQGLIKKGMLDKNGNPTKLGIYESRPFKNL